MTSRYLQNNALESLGGLEQLPSLETLNVSNNRLSHLPTMAGCPKLATFLGAHNDLSAAECIKALWLCTALTTVDLQDNGIADAQVLFKACIAAGLLANCDGTGSRRIGVAAQVVEHLRELPDLRCLYLKGNPVVSSLTGYRMTLIAHLSRLTYLDDRPIFDKERRCAEAW